MRQNEYLWNKGLKLKSSNAPSLLESSSLKFGKEVNCV